MAEQKVPSTAGILADVAQYYSSKLAEFGDTARGVDWNGEESQFARFEQLARIFHHEDEASFAINDLGCGYGALLDYLMARFQDISYVGTDISGDMIRAARVRHAHYPKARFIVAAEPDAIADYGIASGIFNVRLGYTDKDWQEYVETTLDSLNRTSREGFAFNCLTTYSDRDRRRSHLYYADPCILFELCKRRYSRHVALLHDYGLYEFTILVRKQPWQSR